jgi:type IV secretion system protein VirB8
MQDNPKKEILKQRKSNIPVKSWYQDKAFGIAMQRNILLVISIFLFFGIIAALVTIKTIVEKKAVEPYVIKVSKQDQIPVSVNIESVKNYISANQGVLDYFLLEYIRARESYNFETYIFDYNTLVKKMSTSLVFKPFWDNVNDATNGVIANLGRLGKIDIVVKQIALESRNNIIVVRIAKRLIRNGDVKQISHYKIKMHYLFDTSNLTYKDIVLNPLGIKIDFYEVFEEKALVNDEIFNQIL